MSVFDKIVDKITGKDGRASEGEQARQAREELYKAQLFRYKDFGISSKFFNTSRSMPLKQNRKADNLAKFDPGFIANYYSYANAVERKKKQAAAALVKSFT